MDQAVSKLLGMFEESVKALGTQAGRLYPEVVRLYMWEHILSALFAILGFAISGGLFWFFSHKATTYDKKFAYDAGNVAWITGAVVSAICGIVALIGVLIEGYGAARVLVAPEAAFVLDHLQKLIGGR